MVEALISMLILALVAVAFIPMLVAGLKSATANTTVTTATQLVNEELAQVSTREWSCSYLKDTWLPELLAPTAAPKGVVTDERGVRITLTRTVNGGTTLTCPLTTPTATLTVDAADGSPGGAVYASASTVVRVNGP